MLKKASFSGAVILVLVLIYSLHLSVVYAVAEDSIKSYRGTSKCEGIELDISFIYDSKEVAIKDLKTIAKRLDGQASITWAPKTTIKVNKDGTFNFEDEEGNAITLNSKIEKIRFYTDQKNQFINGTLLPTGQASGETGGRIKGIGDEKTNYNLCDKWNATTTGENVVLAKP